MTRDWSLVGGNPAPGNPTLIRDLAGMIATAASDAYEAQASLDGIAADLGATGWEGEAARAFDGAFSPLPGDLGLMAASYDGAARALSVYADRLEAIQAAARHALTRAELASYRRGVADERLAAARGRILDLGRQLAVTRAQEEAAELARAAPLPDDLWSFTDDANLTRVRQQRWSIEQALGSATAEQDSADCARGQADGDLGTARGSIAALATDRREAEQRAARAIAASLAGSLRNDSFGETLFGIVADGVEAAIYLGLGEWDEAVDNVLEVVAALHTVLDKLETLTAILAAGLALVGIAATLVGLSPLGIALLTAAAFATRANRAFGIAKSITGATLLASGRPDSSGRRVGVVEFGVGVATSFDVRVPGTHGAEEHFKRFLFPDARNAIGRWRLVETLHAGQASNQVGRLAHGALGVADLAAPPAVTHIASWVDRKIDDFVSGDEQPVVRPCYATP